MVNLVWTLRRGRVAEANPWQVGTLEWTCAPSPPPEGNFASVPVVLRGPHALSQPEVLARLGRDWMGQAEQDGDSVRDAERAEGGSMSSVGGAA